MPTAAASIIPATVAGWMIKPNIVDADVDHAVVRRVRQWLGVFFAAAGGRRVHVAMDPDLPRPRR